MIDLNQTFNEKIFGLADDEHCESVFWNEDRTRLIVDLKEFNTYLNSCHNIFLFNSLVTFVHVLTLKGFKKVPINSPDLFYLLLAHPNFAPIESYMVDVCVYPSDEDDSDYAE